MSRVSVIFGTRPEAIKLAPVILEMRERHGLDCRVCVTAQHREMLDDALGVFGIRPQADLDLMRPEQSLGELASRAMAALDVFLARERPDLLLIQGDTTTAFCAALAAFYHRIPVGHVEAGLRTGDLDAPWPEELNRLLTSRLAAMHFAPTEASRSNLLAEGVPAQRVHVTGNTVVDALEIARQRVRKAPPRIADLPAYLLASDTATPLVLITTHRREHLGAVMEGILGAIARLAARHPGAAFVFPVHRNPRVRESVRRTLRGAPAGNLHLLEPLSYLEFVALMERCRFVLTDSGGIQEEAPGLGKPVLVLRDRTERPEAVDCGAARLIGTEPERIVQAASELLEDSAAYRQMARVRHPFGDGGASGRIVAAVSDRLGLAR